MADKEKLRLGREVMTELHKTAVYYRDQTHLLEQKLSDREREIALLKDRLAAAQRQERDVTFLLSQVREEREARLNEEQTLREKYLKGIVDCCGRINQCTEQIQKDQRVARAFESNGFAKLLGVTQELQASLGRLLKPEEPEEPVLPELPEEPEEPERLGEYEGPEEPEQTAEPEELPAIAEPQQTREQLPKVTSRDEMDEEERRKLEGGFQ